MVRHYIAKNPRKTHSEAAIAAVKNEFMSYRKAGALHDMSASTLFRAVHRPPGLSLNRVFSDEEESLLEAHILRYAEIGFGLTKLKARRFIYEYAVAVKLADSKRKHPPSWNQHKLAGVDYLSGFLGRHPRISTRKPEATSLARARCFNPTTVAKFFDNLRELKTTHRFAAHQIYNLDETGLMTVVEPPKILAKRGAKQVARIVSAERGTLVTMVGIICADVKQKQVPPVFVVPRKKCRPDYLDDAPEGSLGLANPTGWMNAELYLEVLKHIKAHTNPSVDNKILLLIDNHESHISLPAIQYCLENGIELLSFPPHCSHKMQPLDVAVFGPFKASFKRAEADLMADKTSIFFHIF
jgi:DDE superfamily endonuclease/helix-turn-helix, Psq domain